MGAEASSLKERVGEQSSLHRDLASAERLSAFAAAISAPAGDEAPPTFLTIGRKGEFELLERFGIPLSRILHGEQEYEYLKPIRAGDAIEYRTELSSVLEKRGKSLMQFLVFETEFTVSGDLVARARTNLIHRGASE